MALSRLRKLVSKKPPDDAFDPVFYRTYYEDLASQPTEQALRDHYERHGRREGRHARPETLIEALEVKYGPLPPDFLPTQYRSLHVDLAILEEDWQLTAHYLQFGIAEKRRYRRDLSSYEAAYAELRALSGRLHEAGPGTFEDLLRAHGLLATAWLDRFNLGEFMLLNGDWLEAEPVSRVDGLRVFVEQGLQRIAPIAVGYAFDPAYYRARSRTERAGSSDAELYRHWLNQGMGKAEPGTEAAQIAALLGEETFPDCFRADLYRANWPGRGDVAPRDRATLLDHFVRLGFTEVKAEVVSGPGAARLYEQIGDFQMHRGNAIMAHRAYDKAIALEPPLGRRLHKRGDALRKAGCTRDAVADFIAAARSPDAKVWAHIHAAEGLAQLLDLPGPAVEQLLRSAPTCRGSADWRAAGHRVVARFFAAESAKAHTLYAEGRRAEGDARVGETLSRIADMMAAIDPLPARLPVPAEGPIVIIANRDLAQCDHYRVEQKQRQLEHGGWSVEVYDQHEPEIYRPALDRARLVVFYRVAAIPHVLHALRYAGALGVPTIYEVDDIIFDGAIYPDPFESFEGQITDNEYVGLQHGVPLFRHAMSLCDSGLASTPALAEAMRPLVRSGIVHVLRNGLDERNDAYLQRPPTPFASEEVTIFYGSGTKAHNSDFTDLAAPALLDVMGRHPHVRLLIAGHLHLDERFGAFLRRVRKLEFTPDVDAYWEVLSGADINLAVLKPSPTTDAKSEIKWLEAAMCAIPSIVSPTRTFRETLVDGEDALFATSPEDWTRALDRLVADAALRRRIGERARAKALSEFSLDRAVATLAAFLPPPDTAPAPEPRSTVGAIRPDAAPRKPRLLFVNVYFPPQTHGGATRVLRDNVDHLIDTAAEAFDCAVVATDDLVDPAYETRIDAYRGVPVYRIAAPREAFMDWRPVNPKMTEPFERILERFDPDLVHFHCIQRLTGSIVEAVRTRGTPYVVTLHDAWWISDFQFLVDADGQVDRPGPDAFAMATDRALSSTASIARRRRLGRLLDDAQALIAVSETFADVYRRAGFTAARAIPNGLSNFVPAPKRPSADGRVRLGHVGNRSAHKGATLVELVLRANAFENLSFTVVDHSFDGGTMREERWGTTPVRIIGPVRQAEIAELYAGIDVLLAPSIWPESFGLVTREAQAAGLWVVASDRGAIGEDLVEDVNGFRIDVADMRGLREILRRIDADPARFRASPPAAETPPRTAADQGDDLIAFYESVPAIRTIRDGRV